ncbi:PAS domain-containing protein [Streptomyces sp. NPDC001835]|uniref:PAS domain-containing protein n=1 Tax=unclassified Streptomyces TaxID=2593676 RepID=UPI00331D6657
MIGPAGRIVAVNPAAERPLQRAAGSVHGRDLHDLCHRDPGGGLVPRERCPLLRALAERRAARGDDCRCLRGDGLLVPISWSAPLADDVSGVCLGMVVLIVETAADRRAGRERAERAGQSERVEQAERAARTSAPEGLAELWTFRATSWRPGRPRAARTTSPFSPCACPCPDRAEA